jgi:uncharacterized membrane protein YedE/YeeE
MRFKFAFLIFSLLSGVLFGFGLSVSQMINPDKVLNFLDILGTWDASLILVMTAGLMVSACGVYWVKRRGNAICGDLQLPSNTQIDTRLLIGAALFGIGWGMAGYCPGPILASLAYGNAEALLFIPTMIVGFYLGEQIEKYWHKG